MAFRCDACGNKTRFDVVERKRVRAFYHFSLAGDLTVEEEQILERAVESVTCRWCGSSEQVVEEPAGGSTAAGEDLA